MFSRTLRCPCGGCVLQCNCILVTLGGMFVFVKYEMEPFRSQKRQRPFYFYPVDAIICPNIFKHFPWISPHPMASVWWHAWELMSLHAHMHLCFRLNSRRWEFLCVSSSFMCSLRVRLFISQVFTLAYSKGFRPFLELTELVRSCLWNTRKRQNLLQGYGERRGNGKPFAALWRITLKHKTLSLMPVLWNLLWTSYFFLPLTIVLIWPCFVAFLNSPELAIIL